MSKLTSLFTDIADAIRSKKGTNDKIPAYNFPSEIESIESGGNTLKNLLDNTKSCYYLFRTYRGNNLSKLIQYNDTEKVTTFEGMFFSCTNAISLPQLNTSKGTNFKNMFSSCTKLTNISQLDTGNGNDFTSMFSGCAVITEIPEINTSKGTSLSMMFKSCWKLNKIPKLNTSSSTSISSILEDCYKVPKIDISYFNIHHTTHTGSSFKNCYSLKAIIIRSFGSSYTLNANALTNCYHILGTVHSTYNPNGDKDGYIYVPRDMIETLSSATNWSTYATQFRALEDYTKDGTTTGEFDDEKAGLV